jgi:hypothetical protein
MNSPDKDNPSNEKSSETSETVSSISSIESIDEFYKATGIELSRSHANERLVARTLAHTLRVEVEIRYSSDHGGGSAPFFWVGPGNQREPSDGGIVDDLAICSLKPKLILKPFFEKSH